MRVSWELLRCLQCDVVARRLEHRTVSREGSTLPAAILTPGKFISLHIICAVGAFHLFMPGEAARALISFAR